MTRAVDVAKKLCPTARPEYIQALENGDDKLQAAGITTPRRLAHFLAQIFEETGGLVVTFESMRYTHAQRIHDVWPSRFPTLADAEPYVSTATVDNSKKLAIKVYDGRGGNRPGTDDGWWYRGGGLMQTTFLEDYARYGKVCGADFVGHPELIISAEYALQPALAEWVAKGCNKLADADDINEITHRLNGGYTNLSERKRWLKLLRSVVGDKVDLLSHQAAAAPLTATLVSAGAVAQSGASPITIAVIVGIGFIAVAAIWLAVKWRARSTPINLPPVGELPAAA